VYVGATPPIFGLITFIIIIPLILLSSRIREQHNWIFYWLCLLPKASIAASDVSLMTTGRRILP
jgi:hypothetical protein